MDAPPGDRFCTGCGASLSTAAVGVRTGAPASGAGGGAGTDGDRGGTLGWWAAGVLLVALVVAVTVPRLASDADGGPEAPAGASGVPGGELGPTPSVDLSSMTPREAADRLFDRVIGAWEAGDRAQAARFRPMALAAYDRARPLDPDGHFHVAMLHVTADDWEAARGAARAGLAQDESHLLSLSVAAEAARELGDSAAAVAHHRRFLERYEDEVASGKAEYEAHRALLPGMRRTALEATGAGDTDG